MQPSTSGTDAGKAPLAERPRGAGSVGDGTPGPLAPLREGVRGLMDPLSAVVGFASLLVDGTLQEEERARYARRIHEAARELEQRVRHLEVITRPSPDGEEQLPLF